MKNILLSLLSLVILSCNHNTNDRLDINLSSIVSPNDSLASINNSSYFKKNVLHYSAKDKKELVILKPDSTMNWDNLNFLVLDVYHKNPFSLCFYIYFYKKTGVVEVAVQQGGEKNITGTETPAMTVKLGVLPELQTQLIFPLSYLDNQNIFLKRFPRQLKAMIHGQRLEKNEISKISISYSPYQEPDFTSSIEIASIAFTKNEPTPLPAVTKPIVDEFGQWNLRNWEGKVQSEEQLKENLTSLEKLSETSFFPENWSQYGGWKERKFNASGYYKTHHDGRRWWMVDPEGYAFVSVGIDCIRDNTACPVDTDRDLFSWIPDSAGLYTQCYVPGKRGGMGVDFYRSNLIRVYGQNWKERWEKITAGLIKSWNVNTVACWSDINMARKEKLPYLYFMSGYPSTQKKLFRDFPDVYALEYSQNAHLFAQQLDSLKDDKFMIGYFLNNEPHWAFGAFNIAFEMFAVTDQSETKNEFIKYIEKKYNHSISNFNDSWKTSFTSFDEIRNAVFRDINTLSETAKSDFYDFSKIMVRRYVSLVCDEVKKVDKNHLNFGLRYAWISSDLCYEAGDYFDVFSINSYANPAPSAEMIKKITQRSGKPVSIGEYHFGAVDRGLPATGIQGAESQAARGDAYRYYVEQTIAMPEIIGVHYFQWLDQPITGRFDGENYNIGFVDICNTPYKELTEAAKQSHQIMYEVASGKKKAFEKVIKKVPQIYY